jgi:hypothetical protein
MKHVGSVAVLVIAAACGSTTPQQHAVPPTDRTATAPSVDDGPEIASEGNSSVSVLSRPDHPLVRPKGEPTAKAVTDAQCRSFKGCGERGLCTAQGVNCVAASWGDCEQMTACALGKCVFDAGQCKAVSDCSASHGCKENGACGHAGDKCAAQDTDGCRQSTACARDGVCTLEGGLCIAKRPKDCRDSEVCKTGGQCVVDNGLCKALTDAHCARVPACKEHKKCLARDGVCVSSCAGDTNCQRFGRCGEKGIGNGVSCVALSDKDCEKSGVCAELGHCSAGLRGSCEAGDNVECLRSRSCKEDGRCRAVRGRCLPQSDAECRNSIVACGREGRCRHAEGRCVK